MEGSGLLFVNYFFLEADDRGLDDELGLCSETGDDFVEGFILDEVFQIQGELKFVVSGKFRFKDNVEGVDGLGLDL